MELNCYIKCGNVIQGCAKILNCSYFYVNFRTHMYIVNLSQHKHLNIFSKTTLPKVHVWNVNIERSKC